MIRSLCKEGPPRFLKTVVISIAMSCVVLRVIILVLLNTPKSLRRRNQIEKKQARKKLF